MHRRVLWVLTLALLALPLAAQTQREPASAGTAIELSEQLLFDQLSAPGQESIPAPTPAPIPAAAGL